MSIRTMVYEALLGGVYAPCSLQPFSPFSLPLSIFGTRSFLPIHCSFFISLCSPLLFHVSSCSLIISLAPCSISNFFMLPAPFSKFWCSLLQDYVFLAPFLISGHVPSSLWSQGPFSLLPDYPLWGFKIGPSNYCVT